VRLVLLVQLGLRGLLVPQALLGLKVQLEAKVLLDHRVPQVQRDQQVQLVLTVQ
tara:strand:+ start:377 stop:538 length:162 start_codon:yes stop_codon:yes gene_type:complete